MSLQLWKDLEHQILEGRVEQNRQRVGGKYYSTESSKIASCMLAHYGWAVLYGSEPPQSVNKY